jgi:hypothetical protein
MMLTSSSSSSSSSTRWVGLVSTLMVAACALHGTDAFILRQRPSSATTTLHVQRHDVLRPSKRLPRTRLLSSPSDNDENDGIGGPSGRYSREVRLREEAESPFRKVRYFLYLNVAGGALTSLLISAARIAAALSGVNTDLLDESLQNAAIDALGLAAVFYFYRQDTVAEESRLKRATKGADLARLTVRASKGLLLEGEGIGGGGGGGTFTTTLASFRRQRGIEKRVVIAAAGPDKIRQVLEEAKQLQVELQMNDLIVVPVVMPRGVAPTLPEGDLESLANIALPVTVGAANSWKTLLEDEASEAVAQGVNIETEGFCVVVKKNGRVGQRTRGIFLNNLVGNVVARAEAGMDVKNI